MQNLRTVSMLAEEFTSTARKTELPLLPWLGLLSSRKTINKNAIDRADADAPTNPNPGRAQPDGCQLSPRTFRLRVTSPARGPAEPPLGSDFHDTQTVAKILMLKQNDLRTR